MYLAVFSILFSIIYYILDILLDIDHAIAVFVAFLLLPLSLLILKGEIGKKPEAILKNLGTFDLGFLEGLFIYTIFTGYVFIYYLRDPDFFTRYDKSGTALLVSLAFTALNVIPVDFFTKRFIQGPLSTNYGARSAISLQTLVWLAAHYPESLWLDELMGDIGVWVFLGFTGLITGISYERTKNVSGLMAGHVLLNVFVFGFAKI